MATRKRAPVTCKGCGKTATVNALGYTDIAPALGYCADCINRAMREMREEDK